MELQDFIDDQSQIYGHHYYIFTETFTTKQIQEMELHGEGQPQVMWPAQFIPELDNKPGIPVLWHHTLSRSVGQVVQLVPLQEMLASHHDHIRNTVNNHIIRSSYHVAPAISTIKKIISNWRKTNSNNPLKLKEGYLIRLNESVNSVNIYPFAIVAKIATRDYQRNIQIFRVTESDGSLIRVRASLGYIGSHQIEYIVSKSRQPKTQFIAYQLQKFENEKKKNKKIIKRNKQKALILFEDNIGKKMFKALNESNFNQNKNKQKPVYIEYDMISLDVDFISTQSHLKLTFSTAKQLGRVIGGKNVLREIKGSEYFYHYPLTMKYCHNLQIPKWRFSVKVLKMNACKNLEKK
eukprot:379673_1